jgi:hypothetical protein
MRRLLASLGIAAIGLVALAAPAAADPAQPTNYESQVLSVTPATPAISIKVVGGDGFLDLAVRRGHTVVVHGYGTSGFAQTTDTGEPWLRIDPDGTVEQNRNSPATYLNANRYATKISFPAGFDPDKAPTLAPDWSVIGHGGHHIWHDHRIHWMGKGQAPPLVRGTNQVRLNDRADGDWIVALVVDGKPVTVRGRLVLHAAPSPIPWIALLAVAGVAVAALALVLPFDAILVAGAAATIAGVVALVAGLEERAVVPDAAGGSPVAWALPALAVAVAVAAFVLRNRPTKAIAILSGSAAVLGWGLLRLSALWKAVPLSALSAPAAHALQAAAMGLAVGAAIAAARSGALAIPDTGEPNDEI